MSEKLKEWIENLSNPSYYPWTYYNQNDEDTDPSQFAVDPTYHISDDFKFIGSRDESGQFHGPGTLNFSNGDVVITEFVHGIREGEAVISSPRNGIARLVGIYRNNLLQGPGKIVTTNTSSYDCFYKNSVLHGPVRKIDLKKFREFRRQLSFLGQFSNGRLRGPCWQSVEGRGGFLYADLESDTLRIRDLNDDFGRFFTSDHCGFLFPDFKSGYYGKFENGTMIRAQIAELVDVDDFDGSHILRPKFVIPDPSSKFIRYFRSDKVTITDEPMIADPYESRHVECRESDLNGAGDGLFARHDLLEGTIVAFYNGVRLPYELGGPKETWSTSGYKIFVNADYESGERMDIPEKFVTLKNYRATLGHKMNHSFLPNCSEWFVHHPRFGVIPCERTIRNVRKGEELFLDYEYDPHNCPEWFREALHDFLRRNKDDCEPIINNEKYSRYYEYLKTLPNGILK